MVIVAAAAMTMRWQGRSTFSTTGVIRLWSSDAWGRENSQQLFDPYTFTHITHGVLIYAFLWLVARRLPLRVRLLLGLALESSWEVYENTDGVIERYRAATMALGYYGDSVFNSVGDILASLVGFALAAKLSARATVWVAIGLEGLLTLWIRDGLVLNIIMLIHPIEAVKTWQLELAGSFPFALSSSKPVLSPVEGGAAALQSQATRADSAQCGETFSPRNVAAVAPVTRT